MIYRLRGVVALTLLVCLLLVSCILIYALALVRLVVLVSKIRNAITGAMDGIITVAVGINSWIIRTLGVTKIQTHIEGQLDGRTDWWIVTSNHQSWADILVIQSALWPFAPPLKFFTKQELIWLPLVGWALWLLRFPFVRRRSKEEGRNSESLHQRNQQAMDRAARHFLQRPISLLVFLEGTRFSVAKHKIQNSRYMHLLSPRMGGLKFVLCQLNDRVHRIVDLTLIYPGVVPSFWQFMCGRCRTIDVHIRSFEVDDRFREELGDRVDSIWSQKDALIEKVRVKPLNLDE